MTKIGVRGGWPKPTKLNFEESFRNEVLAVIEVHLGEKVWALIEESCNDFVLGVAKRKSEAQFSETRDLLRQYKRASRNLNKLFLRSMSDTPVAAAWSWMARSANHSSSLNVPDLKTLQTEIENFSILAESSLKAIEEEYGIGSGSDPRGREPNPAISLWIKSIADILVCAGATIIEETPRRRKIRSGFLELISMLAFEIRKTEVFLPSDKQIKELARGALKAYLQDAK